MNKISTLIAVMLIVAAPLAAGTITVSSPNGGESVAIGSTCRITWEATGISQEFKIILLRSGSGRFGTIVENLGGDRRSYDWTVPETMSGDAPVGDYKIRVATMDSETHDDSNTAFAIAAGAEPEPEPEPEPRPDPVFRLIRPNGGERLPLGEYGDIVFDYKNVPVGSISVALYKGGFDDAHRVGTIGTFRVPAFTSTVTRGRMEWRYGQNKSGMAPAGEHCYFIRISVDSATVFDFSDAPFTLFKPQDIVVVSPTSGEKVVIHTPKLQIIWRSPNADSGEDIGATVSLTLVRQSDKRETRIDTGIRNHHGSNGYYWGDFIRRHAEVGEYRVRVDSSSGMTGVSGPFQLTWPEDDFIAEIIPGTMKIRFIGRILGKNEYDFRIETRFRNGSIFNDAVSNVKAMGIIYEWDGSNWKCICSCGEESVTIPANGHWSTTVKFKSSGSYGGLALAPNTWFPLKFVVTIDRDKKLTDSNRNNNEDKVEFTIE